MDSAPRARRGIPPALEVAGLAGVALLAVLFVAISWRKWPHPVIDFGRELYLPWRLANGAVLYRDVDSFYGPLSQYFNAGVFRLFGPGLITLVWANLVIFAAIVTFLYLLLRKAWGVPAALFSTAVFVSVFGFSQLDRFGNANYAAPYAHETTHGILVCLALVWVCEQWIRSGSARSAFIAGLLLGITAVLKPEFMLAGIAVVGTAGVFQWRSNHFGGLRTLLPAAGAALLPTLLFFGYFLFHLSPGNAFTAAGRAWLTVAEGRRFTAEPVQITFLGLDEPWLHFKAHVVATTIVLLILAVAALGLFLSERLRPRTLRLGAQFLVAAAVGYAGIAWINWYYIGRCLLGLLVVYLGWKAIAQVRSRLPATFDPQATTRILLGVLATALMARMALNGRIYQFGYYQAALAGTIIPAIMMSELPGWLPLSSTGRVALAFGSTAMVAAGAVILSTFSAGIYSTKTVEVGAGRDRFFATDFDAQGQLVKVVLDVAQKAPARSMLVLPEGVMINYLTRTASPLAPFFYFSAALGGGREAELVKQLESAPPERVILLSRDLSEYGVNRYGEAIGRGKLLMEWVARNYEVIVPIGDDPLDRKKIGAYVLGPKKASP